jgi:hypothetical protein
LRRRRDGPVQNRCGQNWTATALTADDVLDLPEIGIRVPVAEFYENVAFASE